MVVPFTLKVLNQKFIIPPSMTIKLRTGLKIKQINMVVLYTGKEPVWKTLLKDVTLKVIWLVMVQEFT